MAGSNAAQRIRTPRDPAQDVTLLRAIREAISAATLRPEPEALEEGAELLADLILAACNDALDKSRAAAAANMTQLTAGLGLPPGLL